MDGMVARATGRVKDDLRKFLREVLMVFFFIPLNKNFLHYTLPP
jgi:hypothetical protein